ncbi:MAG: LLM class flavin-dependent oxidoreductase [Acidimicrobiales bacterium]
MTARRTVATDLLISPFSADAAEMVEAARQAEDAGYDGLFTLDHFSGAMVGRGWSREPFTVLGAFAAATRAVRLGPLVANVVNRHPVLLASAAATLQSLSSGRAVLGLGAGAAPGSRFAGEHEAVNRPLADGAGRRRHLIETIEVIRHLWGGGGDHAGEHHRFTGLEGVVGPEPRPPIIVGATSARTVELACRHADGVNVRVGPGLVELVGLARDLTRGRPFEISIFDDFDPAHPLGGELDPLSELGVDRRVLAIRAPYPLRELDRVAERLRAP